ncbi:JmjC domain-containing protein [Reinekea sp.]|jgi:hypothetical protein|uniref:JmjC domain-containing protein n=1 Tax=Reinekea sp. TaxID=1970455 RepID=UPI002A838D04|nr:cupin domain-containing protein [Reinekea sp.]
MQTALGGPLNPLGIPDITSFLQQVFGQSAFCFPTQNGDLVCALAKAFSLADVCWQNQGQWGDIRLAKADSPDARLAERALTAELLRHAFEDGYTLVVSNLQTKNGTFATLCRQLSRQFACPIYCDAYWSPCHSEALALHYDDQDVFVVQVSGGQDWQVDFNAQYWPFGGQVYQPDRVDRCDALQQLSLVPGDILYIPRGNCHRAKTGSEQSFHVTFSINSLRRRDLLLECLAPSLAGLDLLRPALRAEDFDPSRTAASRDGLLAYLEDLTARIRSDTQLVPDALLRVHKNFAAQLPCLDLQLDCELARGRPVLTLDTRLEVNPEQYFVFDEPGLRVYYITGDIRLPDGYRWVFDLLRQNGVFSPREIITQYEQADFELGLDAFVQLLAQNLLWFNHQPG